MALLLNIIDKILSGFENLTGLEQVLMTLQLPMFLNEERR